MNLPNGRLEEPGDSRITSVAHIENMQFEDINQLLQKITEGAQIPADVLYINLEMIANPENLNGGITQATASLLPETIKLGIKDPLELKINQGYANLTNALINVGKTVVIAEGPVYVSNIRHSLGGYRGYTY